MRERPRRRLVKRMIAHRTPPNESEERLRAVETLRAWNVISEDESPERGNAPADIEAPRAELGSYRRWLARTIVAAAAEDYRTLVVSRSGDPSQASKTGTKK